MNLHLVPALSINGIKLVLQELAAFHASGHHFIQTYPGGIDTLAKEYPNCFTESFFNNHEMGEEMAKGFFEMTSNMFGSCVLVTKKYSSEELSSRMSAYHAKVKSIMEGLFTCKWRFSYITHGDAWYNNFMCR